MKTLITASAVLALALTASACGRTDTANTAAVSNDVLLNDETGFDANAVGDAVTLDNGAVENSTLDNTMVESESAPAVNAL